MPKLAFELNDLPVESVDVLPADTLEALETGHGMTEMAASCPLPQPLCVAPICTSCVIASFKAEDDTLQ